MIKKKIDILFCTILIFLVAQSSFGREVDSTARIFNKPYIDIREWRDLPVRHLYVHGGFTNTDTRFSFYFPVKQSYERRFFQYITPFPDNENLSQHGTGEEDKISFSLKNGAYFVETNGGGNLSPGGSPLITAYLANAACADYSRVVAAEIYGDHRAYGYCFGGSGGAYRTIGSIENTQGTWDGAIPYIMGSPMAIPNVFSVRMHAMRILKDKFPQIIEALEPGGNGDMYAGLNDAQIAALKEVTAMGFPPKSWYGYKTMGVHGFSAVYPGMVSADPAYFKDFWEKPGYLGFDDPNSFKSDRIKQSTRIKSLIFEREAIKLGLIPPRVESERGSADLAWKGNGQNDGKIPVAFLLEDTLVNVDFLGGDLKILDGSQQNQLIQISKIEGNSVVIGVGSYPFAAKLKPGDKVLLDNSNFLAAQTYHRHQVPSVQEYPVWKQYLNKDGSPIFPQQKMLIAPLFTKSASGVLPSGKIKGKVILLSSLWDREASPWQAHWYRSKIEDQLKEKAEDNLRIYYTDRALHGDATVQEDPNQTISYLGVLQQALLDLSKWVEKGINPPDNTRYTIENGQVIVPKNAAERKGIQPTIDLKVKGQKSARLKAGTVASFSAEIDLPLNTGQIVDVEIDFNSDGSYEKVKLSKNNKQRFVKVKHKFLARGTFFPTMRVVSQRDGDKNTAFTRIYNLDRVKVVVE
ncbi:hypothetical protein [Pedobacter agri]|uniref:hypothetical protein n=1 Tax=Pedobacter agri TaxID=454586 RepID=UPI00292D4AD1|nr:hypothetical protein [Pedobacter agri]